MKKSGTAWVASAVGALLLFLGPTPLAWAQDAEASRALAVQLFDEAEAHEQRGELAAACPKYAESFRLDPQMGALLHLADCLEKNGQVTSAWGSFRQAEEWALKLDDPRGELAGQRARALESKLSYLIIDVPASVVVPGLEILRDGAPVAQVLWGSRAAIEAGSHRIEARAPGFVGSVQTIRVEAGKPTAQVVIPRLKPQPRSAVAPSADALASRDAFASRRIAAIAIGGLALVGDGVGGFFGLSAQASLSDSKAHCGEKGFCTEQGVGERDSARSKATVATVATGVGAAGLVAAGVLWFTAPQRSAERPQQARQDGWRWAPSGQGLGLEAKRAF